VVLIHRAEVGGGFSDWRYDFVAMSFFDPNALSLLAHELGHHFGLVHTHGRGFATIREAEDYLLSGRPVEDFDGDRFWIDDTPPDPFIASLQYPVSIDSVTLGGRAFSLARKNTMSYWDHGGMGELSHSQIDRVRQIVQERRNRYLDVTIIPPPECAALMKSIETLQERLAEVTEERDTATNLFDELRLDPVVRHLNNRISELTYWANQLGCF
jgi:hypothetical protein